MTSDEIMSLAREAGFSVRGETIRTMHSSGAWVGINNELAKFAELVTSEELRRLHAENEALKANHKIVGYTTKPITWTSERHHSEQIMKITQRAQPEHGFVNPVYAVFNSGET